MLRPKKSNLLKKMIHNSVVIKPYWVQFGLKLLNLQYV
jgi:hypothetical protein